MEASAEILANIKNDNFTCEAIDYWKIDGDTVPNMEYARGLHREYF